MSYFSKIKITDNYGFTVENTPMDEMRVVTPVRLVGSTFVGTTLDTSFWTATVANNGTVTQASGEVTIATNITSANGSAVLQSVRTGRYIGASANRYRGQVQLNNVGETNNVRRWGAYDANNGAFFQLDGTTLSIVTRKNTSDTAVASASWNASTTTPTLTSINSYEIYWTNSKIYFVIAGVLKHTVTASAASWSDTLNLPVRAESVNSNSLQTNNTVIVRVATISRLGNQQTVPTYKHITGAATTICKYNQGTLHKISVNSAGTLCTVYDNSAGSGTPVIAVIDTAKATGNTGTIFYDCPFFNGLSIVTTGAGTDITVVYE